ncbi:SPEG neighbor protein [Rhincodon typus]|uniref:SPEG neighbor protein n=1 Tax=Rhincodon typus TaxID=259920 RepID=UPI00202E5BB1|nr:SPEG neighbor protein [Rhincodon typus]
MSKTAAAKKAAPPPGCTIDINDPKVQDAAIKIQASYRGHRSRQELREKGPPRILKELKDVVLIEGSAARLDCRVSAFPDPLIRWFKNGQELKDGPKYRYVFEDPDVVALVVRDGTLSDLGKYTISISNTFGETFDSAKIIIEGKEIPPDPSRLSYVCSQSSLQPLVSRRITSESPLNFSHPAPSMS